MAMGVLELVVLYVHVLAAIVFVGGSLFIWLAFLPGIGDFSDDLRNQVIVKVTKRFGRVVDVSLVVLFVTGIYNATWYLGGLGFGSVGSKILLAKSLLTLVMVCTIYFNNLYLGRKISATVREIRGAANEALKEQLRARLGAIRRTSHVFSYINLALMLAVVLLAVMLQMPP